MKTGAVVAIVGGAAAAVAVGLVLASKAQARDERALPDETPDDTPNAPKPLPAPKPDAKPTGTTTVAVASAQAVLNKLGATLKPDGLYGPKTKAAWEKAAKARKLAPDFMRHDGEHARVVGATAAALKAAAAKAPKPGPVVIADPDAPPVDDAERKAAEQAAREALEAEKKKAAEQGTTPPGPVVPKPAPKPATPEQAKVGVSSAQSALNKLGAALKLDGLYGPKTAAAWDAEAKKRKLATGFVKLDAKTARVAKATAVAIQAASIVAEAEKETGQKAKPVAPKPAPAPAPKPVAKPAAESVVATVLEAQRKLNAQGAALKEDGLYGPKTRDAWGDLAAKHGVSSRFEKVDAKNVRIDSQTAKKFDALPPLGYDRAKAKAQANDIAAMLKQQGKAYQKKRLVAWQRFAGITADGAYGPHTKAALEYYGAKPPAAFVAGTKTTYKPPA